MDESGERPVLRGQVRLVAYGPDRRETEDVMVGFGSNLRALRAVMGISQEELAVRCFMRRDQMWKIESGKHAPNLLALLRLGYALRVPAAELIDGLEAPVRRVGTARVRDAITHRPGIQQDELAVLLGLPARYVMELTLYLKAVGAIHLGLGGWRAAAEPDDRRSA
jgi:transcriptional regulator with XRE-family HTH domain